MADTLLINEIYLSLQGESTFAGLPCIFIRSTACNLRCSYCDTAYAFNEGKKKSLAAVRTEVKRLAGKFHQEAGVAGKATKPAPRTRSALRTPHSKEESPGPGSHRLPLVELTGGEPLLQKGSLPLMKALCDDGFTVLLET